MVTDNAVHHGRRNDNDAIVQWQRRYNLFRIALEVLYRRGPHPQTKAFCGNVLRQDKNQGDDLLHLIVDDLPTLRSVVVYLRRFDGKRMELRSFDYADFGAPEAARNACANFVKEVGGMLCLKVRETV